MDHYLVDKFNRGLKPESSSDVVNIDDKINKLKSEFAAVAQNAIAEAKRQLSKEIKLDTLENRVKAIEAIGELYSVTNTYFSTKKRRIVSISDGKDPQDAVSMAQLKIVNDKIENLLSGIDVKKNQIKVKGNRKISGVGEGSSENDAVTRKELIELVNIVHGIVQTVSKIK